MTATTYRQLQAGDPLPEGEPRRYRDGRGYIRLRWRVGVQSYVEVYEHRLVMGLPDAEVHHGNEVKGDNGSDNLQPLTKREHAAIHGEASARRAAERAAAGIVTKRDEIKAGKKSRKRARKESADVFWANVARDYAGGETTIALSQKYGRSTGVISRQLRARGVEMRPCGGHNRLSLDEDEVARLLAEPGARAKAIARRYGVSANVVIRIRDARDLPSAPPGRPAVTR